MSRPPRKAKLSDAVIRSLKAEASPYLIWDQKLEGFAVQVQPTGRKAFKVIYRLGGRPRWLTLGGVGRIDFDTARNLAAQALLKVATGVDVQAEKMASRGRGTFEELAHRYVDEYASKKNKSFRQAEALVRLNLIPRWGKMRAADISRSDVKAMLPRIASASSATQTLRAASAIFSWAIREEIGGIKINPCQRIETAKTNERERVLSKSEIPKFWRAFDDAGYLHSAALKLILLTGQRPGEIQFIRREHLVDGWWTLPGAPASELGWPGTKNAENHRVWLPKPAQAILAELDGEGLLFASSRGGVIELSGPMRKICQKLGLTKRDAVRPHDLRRSHGTLITGEPISEAEKVQIEQVSHNEQNDLLCAMQTTPDKSLAELAEVLGWCTTAGIPSKSKVQRVMNGLSKDKLVEKRRGHYQLTKRGTEVLESIPASGTVPF
jgi:integrase